MKYYALKSLRHERPTGKSKVGGVGIFQLSSDDISKQLEAKNVEVLWEGDELPTQSELEGLASTAEQSESQRNQRKGRTGAIHETE